MMIPLDENWLQSHPLARPAGDTNKNDRGRVVVVGGSRFVPGALRLTGEAALRAGAGKLQLGTIAEAALLLGMFVPEAGIFGLATDPEGELDASAADQVIEHARTSDALVLGPGMKASDGCSNLVSRVLSGLPERLPVLLDAAAIAACRDCHEVIRSRSGPVVLTPHHGEMASLTGLDMHHVDGHAEEVAHQVSADLNAVVVLKDAKTLIVAPGSNALIYEGGTPGLATGGSGDILAGVLGGLLARGNLPTIAAAWAVWAHGTAGCALSDQFGGLGLLSRELPSRIPGALSPSF